MPNLLLPIFSILLLSTIPPSSPSLHRTRPLISKSIDINLSSSSPPPPTTFFEVKRPIPVPKTPPCSTLVLHHNFAYTYGKPPVTATYHPPSHCPLLRRRPPSLIILQWSAACAGRQFDRIFGVWLAGIELLRSCTAEPRRTGILWSVRKDVTRYSSLFSKPQTLAVYLGNIVDETYTGIYHVNVSFHFYFDPPPVPPPPEAAAEVPAFVSPADLIVPISKTLPLNDGLWFQIQNSSDIQGKEISIPRNAYRAVLEVFVSFHSSDEFWYTNPPNSYIAENNLTSVPGNGAFREVTVRLDRKLVGAIWPFTVIYTGGINPLLWRPISGIGSFDLPSYDIEITPFLGEILDGRNHFFGFRVTDSLNVWFIDANLHLWIDGRSSSTEGSLIDYKAASFSPSLVAEFKKLDGHFHTVASRRISSTGWVKSSYGKITTHFFQDFNFTNKMKFAGNGSIQEVRQRIDYNHGSYAKYPSSALYSEQVFQNFPLYLYTRTKDQVNDSYSLITNITLGFNEKKFSGESFGFSFSNLSNSQTGYGVMHVKGNLFTGSVAKTEQVYRYEGTGGCYYRNVGSKNYTILYDKSGDNCKSSSEFGQPLNSYWSVRKDVTRYSSLFSKPQTLAVYLGNIVDETYTGIYHVNVSFHFYFDPPPVPPPPEAAAEVPAFVSPADLIVPISKTLPLNDGLWFQIQNSSDIQGKEISIPRNAYRAVLEVFVSFHSSDEFWYTNPPNSYIAENNLTSVPGNGAFREVTVRLDRKLVGAIWPFTVIYTGGINPLLWRPISGIGSFDLPSYDIEITPFLGEILDGRNHFFGFRVTDSLNVWFIDANLHLWIDGRSSSTEGSLIDYKAASFSPSLVAEFKKLDGHFHTVASRRISSTGWVKSSYGKITTHFFQDFNFTNKMKFAGNGSIQEVRQRIDYNHESYAKYSFPSSALYSEQVFQNFPLYLYTRTKDQVNDSYSLITNITLGFNEKKFSGESFGFSFSNLSNSQTGYGVMHVKGNLFTGSVAKTEQVYRYEGTGGCYYRNVGSKNYTILYDKSGDNCKSSSEFGP
ncbi:LOW QUALITY PROTEIN: peptide-N4-(N-acetyl-beta-glucosaminyl)asparagine amidase A-like [Phalaenopsis equestris]|uniref:LOW QUALITY PROTEIN: peptide-N4-(N-acetyl-beta-glucosaminyl)asparagine amidase A-like n=1 Tax=Phalaenopsis equestris TaxID=78828 RepID=UPI0009E2D40B|nr:LOW QUALITY PROTEIN: peptide-N4-(N-acetyl-beta-glucosaminyl)asparagine amidase A-like [Phalaenopsis equestris]